MVSYLALAYLKGASAKAAKINVPPEGFKSVDVSLILYPHEIASIPSPAPYDASAFERYG
jgi:hypothetical protein